ncbi:hypothetical protein [Mesorhizobium erdmanii]|uniref:Uncharacterized protein n=1 Tax=Mesorhizobium erdmanii TaxID=1777866 RepID=A0A6M7UF77_9HYPH|nr:MULTISPECIES: hypothetical protein [Mesorhizobium]OBQ70987.1 hypothetical protein A8146_26340 [Mesorhizobium loti]QKC76589.1 hypothetical protein EB233_14535 [Mesorhizobium erdmanii]
MSDIHSGTGSAAPDIKFGIADWLCLAAAPTFAVMALLSCLQGGEASMMCMGASPLTGMSAMYLLMSAFHLAPWLRVISGRQAR